MTLPDQQPDDESAVTAPKWILETIAQDPYTDLMGRRHFRRLGFMSFARAIPGFAAQWSRIPNAAWSLTTADDGHSAAEISCPCGASPAPPVGMHVACEGCQRFYLFTGSNVMVANSPVRAGNDQTAIAP